MKPPVIILAGGHGTRLHSITGDSVPKPLVTIPFRKQQRPFLSYLLAHLRQQQYCRVVLCVDHLANQFEQYYGDGSRFGMEIRYDFAGHVYTGNRVAHAFKSLGESRAIIHCGDVYHPVDLDRMLNQFDNSPNSVLQVAVHDHNENDPGSPNIAVDRNGEITGYKVGIRSGQRLVHGSGILAARSSIQHYVPNGEQVSLSKDLYPLLARNQAIRAFQSNEVFFDIGTPEVYWRFCQYVLRYKLACL